jgi:hypothetical protein
MDAETWNEKLRQMREASERSQRMLLLHDALGQLVTEATDLGASSVAERLHVLHAETFHLAALAQNHASDLETELEAVRDAGEEPA